MPDVNPGPLSHQSAQPPNPSSTPSRSRFQPPGPADLDRWQRNYTEGYLQNCHNLWTDEEIKRYREWIAAEAVSYLGRDEFKIDCADWTLITVIRFAKQRHLPVGFRIGALSGIPFLGIGIYMGDSYSQPGWETMYDIFERRWRTRIGAADLDELSVGNTIEVAKVEDLLPGDLLITNGGVHVQLILANKSKILAPDGSKEVKARNVLEALQGNLPAAPVERVAWDLENGNYYSHKKGQWSFTRKNTATLHEQWPTQCRGRRWNFAFFDRSVPEDPACAGWLRSNAWMD
jgi:hypothetical protein